jgi:hemoglobin-like flavoprotein
MFYRHFLSNYPEIQKYFERVDIERQSIALISALMVIERHTAKPTRATELYLQHLGTRHHDLQIPQELYAVWVRAMLETMAQFHGDDWTRQLEDEWRQAFDRAIELVLCGYERRFRV